MTNMCIYRIRNIENDKCYIGSAKDYRRRKNKHLNLLNKGIHHNRHLQNAYNLYGESKFIFEIVETVSIPENLVNREEWWINNTNPEYNVLKNGILNHIGIKRSEETRNKISKSLIGKFVSEETKQKLRNLNLGKKQSQATIEKKREKNFKPIIQMNIDDTIVKEWNSATEAEMNGYNRKCIYRCISGERNTYKGFLWRHKSS